VNLTTAEAAVKYSDAVHGAAGVCTRNGYGYNTQRLENSGETRKVCLQTFNTCCVRYSANISAILATSCESTPEASEGTVASAVGIPDPSHVPIGKSSVE
jgi:hypothetical protein